MVVSDALSRAPVPSSETELPKSELIRHVHFIVDNIPISQKRLKQIKGSCENVCGPE